MPHLAVINGIPTMVDDAIPVAIAPRADPPPVYARPDDTVVARPTKPFKIIRAKTPSPEPAPEIELEVREIDVADAPLEEEPNHIPERYRKPSPQGIVEEFVKERIREADADTYVKKTELYEEFKKWYNVNYGDGWFASSIVYKFMSERFGAVKSKGWPKCKLLYDDDEDDPVSPSVAIPEGFVYEPVVDYEGKKVYRHETHKDYGCCFETGEIYRFNHKKNTIAGKLAVNIKNGITLSLGFDEDGNRKQKHYGTHNFVGEVALQHGKIKQISALHTKVAINTACEAYKKREHLKLYPLACLVLTTNGTIDPNKKQPYDPMGYGGAGMSDGASLRDRVKTADQIDDFVAQVRRVNEKLQNKLEARDEEVKKLKEQIQNQNDEINKLKDEIERYAEHANSPLKAGALQLQQLLMTEHQGSTIWEMLQYCVKDITRGCVKESYDDRSDCEADFGVFEMSPRGLSGRNEIITR